MTASHPFEPSIPRLERLIDQALLTGFSELVRHDHHHVANLLRHIDVIDRRKLWARKGHYSLFDFLVRRFHMSESTAGKRIGAARTARRFPVLFAMVARGEIHLSGIHRLKSHLTRENHEQVLALAKHKTICELEELVARLAPQPDVPTTLRALPNRPSPRAPLEPAPVGAQPTPAALPPRRDPNPTPLAPGRYKLQVTINQSTRDKLQELQDLLAHQIPPGGVAVILERAVDALLIQVHERKTGITAKPRAPRARAPRVQAGQSIPMGGRTRTLPVPVRREVWPRDEGRCGFVGEDGQRCNATRGLQFAHRQPWAKGGANTVENVGLRCPAHNALEADRDYGARFMAHKRQQKSLKFREPLARYVVRDAAREAIAGCGGSLRSVGLHEPARAVLESSPQPGTGTVRGEHSLRVAAAPASRRSARGDHDEWQEDSSATRELVSAP